jgi:hypothetical protein
MNKFSKPRLDSRNAKQNYMHHANSTLEKKSVCLARRIVGGGVAYSSRGIPQKYFSTFNQELL